MRHEGWKIECVQGTVEPAVGPPRGIQPLQHAAIGTVDVEPEFAASGAVDGSALENGLRGIVIVIGKN